MSKLKFSTNFTVFILFFGLSLLDAFQNENWALSIFWLIIGIAFLMADNLKTKNKDNNTSKASDNYS